MKSILCFCFLLVSISAVNAQPGFIVGLSGSGQQRRMENLKENTQSIFGLNAGVLYRFRPLRNFAIQPALTYCRKGSEYEPSGGFIGFVPEYRIDKLHYVQLSVPLLYRTPFAVYDVSIGAGPYFGYLVKGLRRSHYPYGIDTREEEMKVGSEISYDYKRMDMGIQIAAGLKYNRWILHLNLDLGLIDVAPRDYETFENRSAAISIGMLL